MTHAHDRYENPLIARYASPAMAQLWGDQRKFSTWRRLWVTLAEAEQALGLDIRDEQIEEMRRAVDRIDFEAAERYERELRHDVMAHIHAFGDQCPSARAIIHLGATSCYVTDNTDLILMREGLELIRDRLVLVIDRLAQFRIRASRSGLSGIHPSATRPADDGGKAGLFVGLRSGPGSGGSRTSTRDIQSPQHQRHDRYPGQLSRAV